MDSVGSFDAKTHLPALLERVSKGESIQITRRGVPVAVLVPAKPQAKDPREVMEQIRNFRKGNRLGGLSTQADRRGPSILSRFVLDASVTVAWCFADQTTVYTGTVLEMLAAGRNRGCAPRRAS